MYYDAKELKQLLIDHNKAGDALLDLGIPQKLFEGMYIDGKGRRRSREIPCPECGGDTRFSIRDVDKGVVVCTHCKEEYGDIYDTIQWALNCDFSTARKWLEDFLKRNGVIR